MSAEEHMACLVRPGDRVLHEGAWVEIATRRNLLSRSAAEFVTTCGATFQVELTDYLTVWVSGEPPVDDPRDDPEWFKPGLCSLADLKEATGG